MEKSKTAQVRDREREIEVMRQSNKQMVQDLDSIKRQLQVRLPSTVAELNLSEEPYLPDGALLTL
jgi:hypothetical protein